MEVESDKISYILSSVFLLSSRLSKSIMALAELDGVISSTSLQGAEKDEQVKERVDDIITKYF